jgi:hypothetical protein
MSTQEIPRKRFAGRTIKPVALGLTLTMTVVAQSNLRNMDRGTQPPLSYVVAFLAGASVAMLIWGWVSRSQRAAEFGLLLVVAAYATRAAFIQLTNPFDQAVFFSLATVIVAAGSWWLEASSHGGDVWTRRFRPSSRR